MSIVGGSSSTSYLKWEVHTRRVPLKVDFLCHTFTLFLLAMILLWTLYGGVRPLIPMLVVSFEFDYYKWEPYYTIFTVKRRHQKKDSCLLWSIKYFCLFVCFIQIRVNSLWDVLQPNPNEFWQFVEKYMYN